MKKQILLLILLFLPITLAATLNDTIIYSTGLNTRITVNETIYFTTLTVGSTGIHFDNYNYSLGSEYIIADFNITATNTNYTHGTTKSLPYISTSAPNVKIIKGVNGSGTAYLSVTSCQIDQILGTDITLTQSEINCTGDYLTLYLNFPNELAIQYTTDDTQDDGGSGGSSTLPTTKNPKRINVIFSEEWRQGSQTAIIIQAYNQEDKLYIPQNIKIEYDTANIELLSSKSNDKNETVTTFEVSEDAEIGTRSLKVIVEDEQTLEKEISIEVVNKISFQIPEITKENTAIWVIAGIAGLFIILILSALIIEKSKSKSLPNEE